MSLNYDYTKVADHDTVMFDEEDNMYTDTQSIIFSFMSVGMTSLEEDTFAEFVTRLRVCEKLRGWTPIPTARIREHLGLSTNVTHEPRSKWLKRWMDYEMDDIKRGVMRECEMYGAPS